MKQIRSYLVRKAPAGKARATLARLLDEPHAQAALLVNERVVNLPAELVPDVQASLQADLTWARERASVAEDREAFSGIKHIILVAPCFREPGEAAGAAGMEDVRYFHFEEEVFAAGAEVSFVFAVAQPGGDAAPARAAAHAVVAEAAAAAAAAAPRPPPKAADAAESEEEDADAGDDDGGGDGDDDDDEDTKADTAAGSLPRRAGGALRPPLCRHVIAFSADRLASCTAAIADLVARATAAAARAAAPVKAAAAAPAGKRPRMR